MQTPFWLQTWQAANSLLTVATDAAVVLPFMALLCLFLGRKSQREAMARAGSIFVNVGLVTAVLGALSILGQGFITLRAIPASMPDLLTPAPYDFLSPAWRGTVTTFLAWTAGTLCLLGVRTCAKPVFETASMQVDEDTARKLDRYALVAVVLALVAGLCFFASLVLRNWPFLGLPDKMTPDAAFSVILKYSWRRTCAALMPAGGITLLTYFLQLPGLTSEQKAKERELRSREVIPGTAEEVKPLSQAEIGSIRMCAAFALAGAAFQLLDAGFVAFSASAGMGVGPMAPFLRYGPFLVSAGALVCWAFVFSRPRRTMLFLVLFPVLLILLRAVAGF